MTLWLRATARPPACEMREVLPAFRHIGGGSRGTDGAFTVTLERQVLMRVPLRRPW